MIIAIIVCFCWTNCWSDLIRRPLHEVKTMSQSGLATTFEIRVKTAEQRRERLLAYISFSQPVDATSIVLSETPVSETTIWFLVMGLLTLQGATFSATSSITTLKLDAQLDAANETVYRMQVRTPHDRNEGEHPCPIHAICSFCSTDGNTLSCEEVAANFSSNAHNHQPLTKFGSQVEYQCGPGRRFKYQNATDHEIFEVSQTRKCGWNGHWQPDYQLPGTGDNIYGH